MNHHDLEPSNDPLMDAEIQIEKNFNKNQLIKRIKAEFIQDTFLQEFLASKDIPYDFGVSLLVQMVLHKRASASTLIGILRHHFDGGNPCQDAANTLHKAIEAELVTWDPVTEQVIIRFDIDDTLKHELELFQYPLPMVVEPRRLGHNTSTPYHALFDGSVILRDNHHDDDVCLDHINRMNRIRFTLDTHTADMIKNTWRNLDKAKPGETRFDFDRRKKAFEKYDRTARQIMGLIEEVAPHFHLTHKYDKRGRIYAQGYHINYQGAPWNKAVIQLADKEHIG